MSTSVVVSLLSDRCFVVFSRVRRHLRGVCVSMWVESIFVLIFVINE